MQMQNSYIFFLKFKIQAKVHGVCLQFSKQFFEHFHKSSQIRRRSKRSHCTEESLHKWIRIFHKMTRPKCMESVSLQSVWKCFQTNCWSTFTNIHPSLYSNTDAKKIKTKPIHYTEEKPTEINPSISLAS